ncbi:hypothetical protein NMG60_11031368 [Bertholletia excelsa]
MEFEEHEEQEEEVPTANYEAVTDLGNSGRPKMGEAMTVGPPSPAGRKGVAYRYRECLKNHAVGIGGHAVDGCGEFMPAGDDGTLDALRCAACNCHRNFHRKEVAAHGGDPFPLHHHHHNQVPQFSPYYRGPTTSTWRLLRITTPALWRCRRLRVMMRTCRRTPAAAEEAQLEAVVPKSGIGQSSRRSRRTRCWHLRRALSGASRSRTRPPYNSSARTPA